MNTLDGVDNLTCIAGQNRMELLLFRLSGRQVFGINVFKVREILPKPVIRSVPYSNRFVRGIMQARGQTISVIDLAAVLSLPSPTALDDESLIVTEYYGHVLGYQVAGVERIVNIRWDDIIPPPPTLGNSYLTAVTTVGDELVEILDIEKVLAEIVGVHDDVSDEVLNELGTAPLRHVFIADDSAVARKQITRVMDQIGVTYEIAENGRLALERLRECAREGPLNTQFSMLISDIEMPEMDGYTLTKTLKTAPDLQDLYVCLHTSLSGEFNKAVADSVGADKLLPKFDPDALAQMVLRKLGN
jgi:two-component system, chemotaxis family, chemotaxis protein CheV